MVYMIHVLFVVFAVVENLKALRNGNNAFGCDGHRFP